MSWTSNRTLDRKHFSKPKLRGSIFGVIPLYRHRDNYCFIHSLWRLLCSKKKVIKYILNSKNLLFFFSIIPLLTWRWQKCCKQLPTKQKKILYERIHTCPYQCRHNSQCSQRMYETTKRRRECMQVLCRNRDFTEMSDRFTFLIKKYNVS